MLFLFLQGAAKDKSAVQQLRSLSKLIIGFKPIIERKQFWAIHDRLIASMNGSSVNCKAIAGTCPSCPYITLIFTKDPSSLVNAAIITDGF